MARVKDVDSFCPTLFRFPGAAGIAAVLRDPGAMLGPDRDGPVWLSESLPGNPGARIFGALVVPCPVEARRSAEPGRWIALNVPIRRSAAWIPPASLRSDLPWSTLASPAEARQLLRRAVADSRARVEAELSRYFEELAALRAAGAKEPRTAWCDVAPARRRRILGEHGIPLRWTA